MNPRRVLFAIGLACAVAIAPAQEAVTLEDCERDRGANPGSLDAYRCFDKLTRVPGGRTQATARLEQLVAAEPDNTHARLFLARVLDARQPRPLEILERVIADYDSAGDRLGLGWAHIYRSRILMVNMRLDEAELDGERATALAEELDAFELLALCRFQESRIASLRGDDGRLFGVLRALVLDPRFETLSPNFRCAVLQNLGSICGELGLLDTGWGYLKQAEALALEHDIRIWLFDSLFSMSSIAMARIEGGEPAESEALELARRALEVADPGWRRSMAELRVAQLTPGEEGLSLLREMSLGPAGASFGGFEVRTAYGLRLLADHSDDAFEAVGVMEEALQSAQSAGMPRNVARGMTNLARARLAAGPRDAGIDVSLRAMDAVERLHDLQSGDTIGALNFSLYSPLYYTLVGELLDGEPAFDDLDLAVRVSERLRSRLLVEHLDRARGEAGSGDAPPTRRNEILARISELQLRMILEELDGPQRDEITAELERLEEEETLLRAAADRENPAPMRREATGIESIQHELRGDEALLSFLLSSPTHGGSWLFALTSTDARTYPLPPRKAIEDAVRFWLGLLQRDDDVAAESAVRLYDDLVGAALADLPRGVRRLIVVPDGALHRLPFDALRPGPDAPPLVEEWEVTLAPSAGVWLRLRGGTEEPTADRALLLADPEFPASALDTADLRTFRFAEIAVGRLPHAREEARAAARSLGHSDVRLGLAASEAFLKQTALEPYRVLHFAAHALIDEDSPDRSAILLAAGDESEDGLLQAREVLDLNLDGALVTLSACQSAGGRVVTGEGVMGLGRSFFQARAAAVVGSLWPLRDEDTADLMDAFYRGLGQGRTVSDALRRAKRALYRDGAPASAWAGVVVLGNGDLVPWRGARGGWTPLRVTLVAAVALIGLLVVRRTYGRLRRAA